MYYMRFSCLRCRPNRLATVTLCTKHDIASLLLHLWANGGFVYSVYSQTQPPFNAKIPGWYVFFFIFRTIAHVLNVLLALVHASATYSHWKA